MHKPKLQVQQKKSAKLLHSVGHWSVDIGFDAAKRSKLTLIAS